MDPLRSHVSQEIHNLMKTSENQVIDAVTKVIHSRVSVSMVVGFIIFVSFLFSLIFYVLFVFLCLYFCMSIVFDSLFTFFRSIFCK